MFEAYAHNPILPPDTFVPDVEAHVWADGRLYLYGSFDIEGRNAYCSDRHHVYSTDDLVHWVDHGVAFTTKDIGWLNKGEGADALYAPDCAYRNGMYYLYYCIPDGRCGVAASRNPWGPFDDVGQLKNVMGIDPAVLIDDDGQAYLYWGQFDGVRVAKLKENMVEIDTDSAMQPLSVKEHEFHEGSSVKKINGKYYFLFTDTHRHADRNNGLGMATSMGYAVSDHPMHGFKYHGIIIDNLGCDPKTWNNHGSMTCFKGQWYVFYHRSTHASEFSRHVCMEPISILPDGTIPEVHMTSSGAAGSIPAANVIPASFACGLTGNAFIAGEQGSKHHLAVCGIRSGDTALYRWLVFDGENVFALRFRCDGQCDVKLYVDQAYHATVYAGKADEYRTFSISIPAIRGLHAVTLRFAGGFENAALEEISFLKA